MKQQIRSIVVFFMFVIVFFVARQPTFADEGMWLFENPPKQQVKEKYSFELTDAWLDQVRQASCRFGNSGSASFVSSKGLILTNHHVGARQLYNLSTSENNLLEKGFYANNQADELACPGLEVIVLKKTTDITPEIIKRTIDQDGQPLGAEEAAKIRKEFIAKIEQEAADETGLRCEVITLYQGGAYHLYGYKVYKDIRLVWAPEEKIAAFGGDPDNYEYPRYCLDACLFRAYEDGQPAKIEHYLGWNRNGMKDGELVFVSGHPGTTNRAYTKEHLEYLRDVYFPHRLTKLFRREVVYSAYGNRSLENQQKISNDLGTVQNYRKRAMGQLDGLQTPSLWDGKLSAEGKDDDTPEARIAAACEYARQFYVAYDMLEKGDFMKTSGDAFNCRTFQIAKTLVRLAYEMEKPNDERMKEFRDGSLDALKTSLLAETPIHEDIEVLKLTDSLTMLREMKDLSDECGDEKSNNLWYVAMILDLSKSFKAAGPNEKEKENDISPKEWAHRLIRGSKLHDVSERKRLIEGGVKTIEESDDPMIKLAMNIELIGSLIRDEYEEKFETPIRDAYAELARRRFEELGTSVYPDATFTLRLSYGAVKGYTEDDGTKVEPLTDIAGMFERATARKNKEPFDPPQSWKDGKSKLDLNVKFNFVSTNDTIGGNSGSPVINTKGEVVGLIFDGNIYSLSNNFVYTERQNRCVSVHADVIIESLKKIYQADRIVDELGK